MVLFYSLRFNLLFIIGMSLIISCADNKNKIVEEAPLVEDNKTIVPILKKEQPGDKKESTVSTFSNPRKPHLDSIKKWNAELISEKEEFRIMANAETQTFSIDRNSGEVIGCSLLAFKGISDDKFWSDIKENRKELENKFTKIKPKIRSNIMENKKRELWYGDPKNIEIEGTPEAVHSGRGPTGYLYSNNGKHLIVPVGYPHGGMTDELFFFNGNAEQTFVIVSDKVNGDFYFFKTDGSLERKGNFNKITGSKGTSYGKPVISRTGKFWMLQNNLGYLFKNDLLVTKIDGNNCFIDEDNKFLHYFQGNNYLITDLKNSKIEYQLIQRDILLLNINGKRVRVKNLQTKNKYSYEII